MVKFRSVLGRLRPVAVRSLKRLGLLTRIRNAGAPVRLVERGHADPHRASVNVERLGWDGPFAVLNPPESAALLSEYHRLSSRLVSPSELSVWDAGSEPRAWSKSLHAVSPMFYDLARHPSIVAAVLSVLGPNIVAWGVSVTHRRPGDVHRWHVDQEHVKWPGISVFLGLEGTVPGMSGLRFMERSHGMSARPSGSLLPRAVLRLAKKERADAEIVEPLVGEGECVVFHGLTWHGSENRSSRPRFSVILQYTTPEHAAYMPLNVNPPIAWHTTRPPCVLVAGTDDYERNRYIARPQSANAALA